MSFKEKEPFVVVFEDGNPVIIQNGKKYTLNKLEIKEKEENELDTNKTTDSENSSKKQSRSNK